MYTLPGISRRLRFRLLAGLAAPIAFSVASAGFADQEVIPHRPALTAPAVQVPLNLATYRSLALERQPALAAYRSSQAAAEVKAQALDRLVLAGLVRRDLPIRRQQAALGIDVARARVNQAEWDTLYAVTRTYLTVLYARQQLALADEALFDKTTGLAYLRDLGASIAKEEKRRDVKEWDVDRVRVLFQTIQGRREQAKQGVERALAALREAIGVGADCPLTLPSGELPLVTLVLDKNLIVSLALERRGEIHQSRLGSEVTCLEIEAQNLIHGPTGQTFASASDIHAQPIPQGLADGEYRPGAVSIEMPANLVGKRPDRIKQAEALYGRATAVVAKTRNLVTLEAEDAYLHWKETSEQAKAYAAAAKTARAAADRLSREFKITVPGGAVALPTYNELVDARVRATRQRLLANQARYEMLLALAALERITAGGISPGFEPAPAAKP